MVFTQPRLSIDANSLRYSITNADIQELHLPRRKPRLIALSAPQQLYVKREPDAGRGFDLLAS